MTATATATESLQWAGMPSSASGDTVFKGQAPAHCPPPEPIDSIEEAAERMFTDGFIQFPDLFSTDESAEIREWMDRIGEPDEKYEFKNWCFNKEVMADYRNDPMWQRFVDRDPVPRVLKLVFGSDAYVNWSKIWVTGKGRAMGMHIDHFDVLLPEDVLMDERVRIPVFNATLHLYFEDQIEGARARPWSSPAATGRGRGAARRVDLAWDRAQDGVGQGGRRGALPATTSGTARR